MALTSLLFILPHLHGTVLNTRFSLLLFYILKMQILPLFCIEDKLTHFVLKISLYASLLFIY